MINRTHFIKPYLEVRVDRRHRQHAHHDGDEAQRLPHGGPPRLGYRVVRELSPQLPVGTGGGGGGGGGDGGQDKKEEEAGRQQEVEGFGDQLHGVVKGACAG